MGELQANVAALSAQLAEAEEDAAATLSALGLESSIVEHMAAALAALGGDVEGVRARAEAEYDFGDDDDEAAPNSGDGAHAQATVSSAAGPSERTIEATLGRSPDADAPGASTSTDVPTAVPPASVGSGSFAGFDGATSHSETASMWASTASAAYMPSDPSESLPSERVSAVVAPELSNGGASFAAGSSHAVPSAPAAAWDSDDDDDGDLPWGASPAAPAAPVQAGAGLSQPSSSLTPESAAPAQGADDPWEEVEHAAGGAADASTAHPGSVAAAAAAHPAAHTSATADAGTGWHTALTAAEQAHAEDAAHSSAQTTAEHSSAWPEADGHAMAAWGAHDTAAHAYGDAGGGWPAADPGAESSMGQSPSAVAAPAASGAGAWAADAGGGWPHATSTAVDEQPQRGDAAPVAAGAHGFGSWGVPASVAPDMLGSTAAAANGGWHPSTQPAAADTAASVGTAQAAPVGGVAPLPGGAGWGSDDDDWGWDASAGGQEQAWGGWGGAPQGAAGTEQGW